MATIREILRECPNRKFPTLNQKLLRLVDHLEIYFTW